MAGIKGVIAKRHNGATQSGTGFGSGTPQGPGPKFARKHVSLASGHPGHPRTSLSED